VSYYVTIVAPQALIGFKAKALIALIKNARTKMKYAFLPVRMVETFGK
jgi:hypothetical protein